MCTVIAVTTLYSYVPMPDNINAPRLPISYTKGSGL